MTTSGSAPGFKVPAQDERVVVVTGSASGIGAATSTYLAARGCRVIGVDLDEADVIADLSTREGRLALVSGVDALAPNGIDGIVANAGVFRADSLCLRVNYFGAVATLEGLRPRLRPGSPRAVLVTSRALLQPVAHEVVQACLAGDEELAVQLADARAVGETAYATSKRAAACWVRRSAPTKLWAGAGIPLNGVAPGSVATPMTVAHRTPEERERTIRERPMPLGGQAVASDIAPAIGFFLSPENTKATGQVLMVDGGGEALMRGEDIWSSVGQH